MAGSTTALNTWTTAARIIPDMFATKKNRAENKIDERDDGMLDGKK